MFYHVQTSLEVPRGNCWQTCVACILDLPAEALPPQAETERFPRYMNALNAYLEKHHNLMYASIQEYEWRAILKTYGHHPSGLYMWEGPTIRTPEHGMEHVVVAQGHMMLHDPHPSRAGLTQVKRWGVLGPVPDVVREWRDKRRESDPELFCPCPACWEDYDKRKKDAEAKKVGENVAGS